MNCLLANELFGLNNLSFDGYPAEGGNAFFSH